MKKSLILLGLLGLQQAFAQTGKVGINTDNPSATLNVKSKTGTTSSTKNLELENASGTKLVTVLDDGKVGIGTTSPSTKLEVNNGTTNGAIKIVDGTQGAGKVLTSDANGVGTWEEVKSYYTKMVAMSNTDITYDSTSFRAFPGIDGFTAPKTGYYMVTYHSFLQASTTGMKSFYFRIKKNDNPITSDETYNYVEADKWFNSHYFTVVQLTENDKITFEIQPVTGAPLILKNFVAGRNIVEVIYLGK